MTGPLGGPPPNRDRFLAGIAERIAPDRVQALYLFSAIRQGPVETGVAVIAADPAREEGAAPAEPAAVRERPIVLTARYRHTVRGSDRGKWEIEIVEQADAPLTTVELVVQGVQRRLAEPTDPELLDGAALRAAAADGVWTPAR
jgi:hypothetical protein